MLSVIIPARNEQFLVPTVKDILAKATGEVEVVVVLDGYWPDPPLPSDKRIIQIHRGKSAGMRSAINAAAEVAKGEYLMKLDAHCMLAEGFDETLSTECDDDWVVIPRRKRLDAEKWCIQDVGKPDIDACYLGFPDDAKGWGGAGMNGKVWNARIAARKAILLDDEMTFQGSCWFLHKKYFEFLELMDEENYGSFGKEPQELCLKAWLSGGQVKRNKKTWYAHLRKGKQYGRGYHLNKKDFYKATRYTNLWCLNKAWHKQTKPFRWLIDHFAPVPGWEEKAKWNADGSLLFDGEFNI